jgi:hypothetical protein
MCAVDVKGQADLQEGTDATPLFVSMHMHMTRVCVCDRRLKDTMIDCQREPCRMFWWVRSFIKRFIRVS